MNDVHACPEHEKLRCFLLGETSEQDADLLEQHLHECQRCQETLHGIQASDTLVDALRAQRDASSPPSDVPDEQLTRLINLRDSARADDSASAARETPAAEPVNAEAYAFLAPPQQPDELGRLGPYRVLAVLGAGGMGVVFKAEDPQLGRLVALKAMLPSISNNPSARQRFLREARAAAAIKHDHIVVIHQVGEDRGAAYLAMEFLEGQPLDERLKDKTSGKPISLPLAESLRIGGEIAQGLEAAHERGLVHRDIKPANVWLEGKRARVKVLDFGLARAADTDEQLTRDGAIVGTPAYMAPEQARGEKIDARCDLFSLGCILYRMCTGVPPFKGADAVSTLMAVAMNEPAPPAAVNAAVPASLSALIMRLLAKNPADRPASAEVVVTALSEIERSLVDRTPVSLASMSDVPSTQRELRAQASGGAKKPPTRVLLAAAAGFLFVCLGVWVIVRDKDGKQLAKIRVDDGKTVEISPDDAPKALTPTAVIPKPATGDGAPPPAAPVKSAFDALRREAIDPYELKVAGGGNAALAPAQLVGIYGDSRLAQGDVVLGLTLLPDDQTIVSLASMCDQTCLTFWDRESGRKKSSTVLPTNSSDISASPDGTLFACAGRDPVRIWEYPAMREYRNLSTVDRESVRTFRISPNNRWGAGVGLAGTIFIWDLVDNRLIHRVAGEKRDYGDLAFHPDNSILAVTDNPKEPGILLWELPSLKPLPKLKGHTKIVTGVAFSADGKSLFSAATDGTLLRWDWAKQESHTVVNAGPAFDFVAVHPDGQTIATSDRNGDIILWEAASGVKKQTLASKYSIPGGKTTRSQIQFGRDGRFLVSCNPELTGIAVWNLTDGEQSVTQGHRELLRELAIMPDGNRFVTNSTKGTARIWNVASGKVEKSFATAVPDRLPKSMALSPDGATLAVGSQNNVRLWGLADGTYLRSYEANNRPIRHVQFTRDGNYLGARGQYVWIWNVQTGGERKLWLEGSSSEGWAMSADGETAYVKKDGPDISRYRTSDWTLRPDWPLDKTPNKSSGGTPTLTADGELLVVQGNLFPNATTILEAESGKLLVKLPPALHIATAPQGQRVAGTWLHKYWVWDRASGLQEFAFPESVILGYPVFSPDGRHLVTSNPNGTVYALRLPERSSADVKVAPQTAVVPAAQSAMPATRLDVESPFILTRAKPGKGDKQVACTTLARAAQLLEDGDTIEVHGNGPFQAGRLDLGERGFTLRAAAGYRPVFKVAVQRDPAISYKNRAVTIEGCDFRSPGTDVFSFFRTDEGSLECKNCRFLLGWGSIIAAHPARVKFADCLLLISRGSWLNLYKPQLEKFELEAENCVIWMPERIVLNPDKECHWKVVLRHNTIVTNGTLAADLSAMGNVSLDVEAVGNIFQLNQRNSNDYTHARVDTWKDKLHWHGSHNLYVGTKEGLALWHDKDGKNKTYGLAGWDAFWGAKEEGSADAPQIFPAWRSLFHAGSPQALVQTLQPLTEAIRGQHGPALADVGPDWSLVGPGAAYVRALAAQGKPVAPADIRPKPVEGAPFVVLREGKVVRAFDQFDPAVAATQSGDVLEIRTDDAVTTKPIANPTEPKTLLVRAAPGYTPIIEMGAHWIVPNLTLSVEGLHFRQGNLTLGYSNSGKNARLARVANCSFADEAGEWQLGSLGRASGSFFQTPDGQSCVIVNCLMPGAVCPYLGPGSKLVIRDSVIGQICFSGPAAAGEIQVDIDHAILWVPPGQPYGAGCFSGGPQGSSKGPLSLPRLQVRNSVLENADQLVSLGHKEMKLAEWIGAGNVYRVGEQTWYGTNGATLPSVTSLGEWKSLWKSDADSIQLDPSVYDPLQWQLLPGTAGHKQGPEGRDYGADVSRVARTAPAEPSAPQPAPVQSDRAGVDDAWVKQVAALPTARQLDAVSKKLQELNPGFDGKLTGANGKGIPKIEQGMVTETGFVSDHVSDVSPIRAFAGLKALGCTTSYHVQGKIADLSQLRGLRLTTLIVTGNQVDDLSPLAGMPLTTLDISGNAKLADLSPLHGMRLATLSFGYTQVLDLSPLDGLPLTQLDCRFTPVTDLSPLKGMPLSDLKCGATQVSDLSPLKGVRLSRFECSGAPISDLSPLNGMPIIELSIGNCKKVFDLSPLAGMPLVNLQCPLTKITDLSQIKGLPLKEANFSYSPLTDLEPLRGLPLEILDLNNTPVSDLSPLAGMKLTQLRLVGTRVSDLAPLRGMPLTGLVLDGTPVSDLSPLEGMRLETLYCTSTKVTDLSPLRGMPLGVLTINNSPVSDLSPLRGIRSAGTLNCSNTKVSDLSQFEDWKNLTRLNLKGAPVTADGVAKLQRALPNCKIEWDVSVEPTATAPAASGTGK